MADDQINNSSQLTVSSGQRNLTVRRKLPTVNPEPFYQDELDVLEAVLKLEKKYGKTFLTEEQRGKLEGSGRVGGNHMRKMNRESMVRVADGVVGNLLSRLEAELPEIFSGEDWGELSVKEKMDARKIMFSMIFGMSPEQFRLNVYKQMGGTV
jgi:hypothetical protein